MPQESYEGSEVDDFGSEDGSAGESEEEEVVMVPKKKGKGLEGPLMSKKAQSAAKKMYALPSRRYIII